MNVSKGYCRQNIRDNFVGMICTPRKTVSSTLWLVICDKCTGQSSSKYTISNKPLLGERWAKLSSSSNFHTKISVPLAGWGEGERKQARLVCVSYWYFLKYLRKLDRKEPWSWLLCKYSYAGNKVCVYILAVLQANTVTLKIKAVLFQNVHFNGKHWIWKVSIRA